MIRRTPSDEVLTVADVQVNELSGISNETIVTIEMSIVYNECQLEEVRVTISTRFMY